jgi:hypothetical protein
MKRLIPTLALALLAPTALLAAPARADVSSPATFTDAAGDVRNAKLDIRTVTVKNTARKLVVRVTFPGNPRVFDFPTGNVSVFIDTDATRKGAKFGHFMEFWSDYRFAKVERWREHPTPAWGHSPEGRCVADAGVIHDKGHHLRWFKYVVKKREGCFTAGAVRVAVSTMNTGDLDPYVEYDKPALDYLGKKHQWTDWISQS